ncbi:hypothetical protein [Sandarakinorhabdus glacialis]|nr:hypothetical protein [Polymorphobacter glacialis]
MPRAVNSSMMAWKIGSSDSSGVGVSEAVSSAWTVSSPISR